ncbi:MAG: hypothetical protein QOI34_406, partial [Verrucomicrobiota bacterium]
MEWRLLNTGAFSLPLYTTRQRFFATSTFALAWIVALSFSARSLLSYESAPGAVGKVPSTWPSRSKIQLSPNGDTLVMLAHPHCPCTRASIGELAQVIAHVQGKIKAYVLFLHPDDSPGDWDNTDLTRSAAQIPGVTLVADLNGVEARRFGAETSGQTLLFDSTGRLLFHGGITESRGHAGGNAGENAII